MYLLQKHIDCSSEDINDLLFFNIRQYFKAITQVGLLTERYSVEKGEVSTVW